MENDHRKRSRNCALLVRGLLPHSIHRIHFRRTATGTLKKGMTTTWGYAGIAIPPPHVTNQLIRDALHPLTVNSLDLLAKRASVRGWYSGTATDSEDTLLFSQLNDIGSMNEVFPLEQAQAAYDRMMSGKARFRVVLKIDQ